jgi:hypothetical protein
MDKYACRGGFIMAKKKVSMTIDTDVFKLFQSYCAQNGMKVSTKVEQIMKETIKNVPLQKFIKEE